MCAAPIGGLKQVAGDLQELKREAVHQRITERKKAQTLQQLIAVGQARGMKNPVGWAKHVHNARQRS
jgi:DNA repair protein RadD